MDGRMWNLIWGSIELILQLVGPSQRKEFFLEKKKVGIAGGYFPNAGRVFSEGDGGKNYFLPL